MLEDTNLPPHTALRFEDIKKVIYFISNFAEANAIILPGWQPYGWKTDCKLLPKNCTKKCVFELYEKEMSKLIEEFENQQAQEVTQSQ